MGILRFHQVTPTGGDCCAGYEVETDRQHRNYTVRELIDIILTERPNEWGSITVWPMINENNKPDWNKAKGICSYSHGKIESKSDLNLDVYGDYRPYKITSNGGWSAMDYRFYVIV